MDTDVIMENSIIQKPLLETEIPADLQYGTMFYIFRTNCAILDVINLRGYAQICVDSPRIIALSLQGKLCYDFPTNGTGRFLSGNRTELTELK